MHDVVDAPATLSHVERTLVRVAAVVAVGDEPAVRDVLARALDAAVPPPWVEEVLLQSYMFAGFPRALNAMREWRRLSGLAAPAVDPDLDRDDHLVRGEATCARVYGHFYPKLRDNVAALHPALDRWMVEAGYGQVLGRPALSLARRELCVVAVCAAAAQERQLQSHLHGALHVGVDPAVITETLAAVADLARDGGDRAGRLWDHVRASASRPD
ncbi:carboxymuconolactone decarboxylase [Gemmatimonadetes bacterium T265]|nr:carboxymuconolactone decarboxylase [Gemmatimonadetes bacterium T265]